MAAYHCQSTAPKIIQSPNLPLAPEGDNGPITLLISFLLNLGAEADGAHDSVTELLIENGLVCVSVVLDNFVESVDQRLSRRHLHLATTVWVSAKLALECGLIDLEDFGEVLNVVGAGHGLTVEEGCDNHFLTAERLGNGLKGEVLGLLGFEKGRRGGR